MPWTVQQNDGQWCVYKALDSGEPAGEALGCHDSEEEAETQLRALYASVEEQAGADNVPEPVAELETVNDTIVSEFGGLVPSVPFAPGVNKDALTEGDADPMFLVLPISEVGRVSRNGLVHDQQFADTLVKQIMDGRPGGIMGHIPDNQRNTSYPVSQIHWVGAMQHGSRVWAKGYIPRTMTDVREEYRVLKAKGGKAATSVYGRAVKEIDSGNPNQWRARQFQLEQIDLAPHSRAALPGDGSFVLAREMAEDTGNTPEATKENPMADTPNVQELTIEDIRKLALFADLKTAIVQEYEAEHETQSRIAELETDVKQKDERIAELEAENEKHAATLSEYRIKQFDTDLDAKIAELTDWQVNGDAGKAKLQSLRNVMRKMALVQLGDVREMEQAGTTLAELMEGDLKELVELTRDALAGPAALVPGKDRDNGGIEIDTSEAAGRKAMAEMGLSV